MNLLNQLTSANLLGWFSKLSAAWKPAASSSSPVPAPNASTPAGKTPVATVANSASETGQALISLLDLLAKKQAQ